MYVDSRARGWSLATCEETKVPILRKEWVCADFHEGKHGWMGRECKQVC